MALRTAPEPLYLELELRYGFWPDLLTPPTSYSRPIEIASMSIAPPEQESLRVMGRNISTRGNVLLSLRRPTGTPAALTLTCLSYDPALLALAMGGEVTAITQAGGTILSQAVTLAVGVAAPLSGRFLDATSFAVGAGDSAAVGVEGSDTGLTFTALEPTASGASDITITIVDPASASAALAVSVSGTDISVQLATNSSSVEISTAAQVLAAVNAHAGASALVVCSHTGASDGSGTMPAVSETALTGGALVAASAYEIDAEGGFVLALTSAAAGAQRVYAVTEAATLERYAGGGASTGYIHLTGAGLSRATGKRGQLDVWQAAVSPTSPIVAPQDDAAFQAVFEGDLAVPSVAVRGITPTRAYLFDDRRA